MGSDKPDTSLQRDLETVDLSRWAPELMNDSHPLEACDVVFHLSETKRLLISFKEPEASLAKAFADDGPHKVQVVFSDETTRDVLILSRSVNSEEEGSRCQGVLATAPLILGKRRHFRSMTGTVYNLQPDRMFKRLELVSQDASVIITPCARAREKYKAASDQKRVLVKVGSFEITPHEEEYTAEQAASLLSQIWQFLRFVVGANVGFGPWIAQDQEGDLVATQVDIGMFDTPESAQNWSAFFSSDEIAQLFKLYQNVAKDKELESITRRAFSLYRTSTVARNSAGLETAVVVAQSLLELLCDHVLQRHAGWTSKLSDSVRGFHNKLSASSAAIGFNGQILSEAGGLVNAYKGKNPENDFHFLTMARNDITHASPRVSLSGFDLHETWNAMMFLAELHIFFILGYRGKINDRRRIGGWFGETIKVPLR